MPRMEVSPAQRHPASQQGGKGRWKPGWRSLGEVGGWRFSTFFYFQTRTSRFQSICQLWIGGLAPRTSFQPSWGDEMTWMKVKVLSLYLNLLVNLSTEYQCLIRSWGRKYSYDDSINSNIQAFSCSKRTTNKHHKKQLFILIWLSKKPFFQCSC